MNDFRVLFLTNTVLCAFAPIAADQFKWVFASDFDSLLLTNATPQQEHQLLLEGLSQTDFGNFVFALNLELVVKSTGDDFFGLSIDDANASGENEAIARAAFVDCFTNLQCQDSVGKALQLTMANFRDVIVSGSISKSFSKMCSSIDKHLKNESIYSAAKNEYAKLGRNTSKKIYQYGIPKSKDDFRKVFAELINRPQMKKLRLNTAYASSYGKDDRITRQSVTELLKVPGKLEVVQRIYENSIDEVTSTVKDISPAEIDLDDPVFGNDRKLGSKIRENFVSQIRANVDLKDIFEPIQKRVRHSV